MDWILRLNETIQYIETHLNEEIQTDKLAQIACCSSYHYQRMFAYMADLPLSEYIRRRRMTRAAVDLQQGGKIIDVALQYGYTSPTAFNRAFQSFHGIPPSQAKKSGARLKSFSPIGFTFTIKGAQEMNYQIQEKEAFRIVGISKPLHKEMEKNFAMVPTMWEKANTDGTVSRLVGLMNSQPMGVLGVSACGADENWRYYIAVASTSEDIDGLDSYTVPKATWAIFTGEGSGRSIQELEKRVITEWLPTSGYEYGNAPDIEVYLGEPSDHMKYEVWIPVIKK